MGRLRLITRIIRDVGWESLFFVAVALFFAIVGVVAAIHGNLLWIIATVIAGPIGLGILALRLADEKVRPLIRDLRAKPISAETRVAGKRTKSETKSEGFGAYARETEVTRRYMSFERPLDGSFEVTRWEFETFEKGERVLVRYFPHSKTTANIGPTKAQRQFDGGLQLGDTGRWQEALAEFDECIKLDPDFGEAYYSRGCVHAELGNFRRAIEDLVKAISLTTDLTTKAELEELVEELRTKEA